MNPSVYRNHFPAEPPVRVLVTGSRHWSDPEPIRRIVASLNERYGDHLCIIHGAAQGADSHFDWAAKDAGVAVEIHPAEWGDIHREGALVRKRRDGSLYDARAGPARNKRMVDAGARFAIAVHPDLPNGKGTLDCVKQAMATGIPVWWVDGRGREPVRVTRELLETGNRP